MYRVQISHVHLLNLPGMVQNTICISHHQEALDVQDANKPTELDATGLQIDSQVGRESHKILLSKTTTACQENSTPGLGVKLRQCTCRYSKTFIDILRYAEEYVVK